METERTAKPSTPLWRRPTVLAGLVIEASLLALIPLGPLRGPALIPFLALFLIAGAAYVLAVAWLGRREIPLRAMWVLAVLFRLTLLFTSPPSLSDDVYRYLWDGHLSNLGLNPYSHAVNSPLLDAYAIPARALVSHDWMATPYLPAAQAYFAAVARLAPQSPLAFQTAAASLDLLTGWLVFDLLRRLGLPGEQALIYLWNPLVAVEFAHGAHVDALMICLTMAAFWLLASAPQIRARLLGWASVGALAAATLTKGLPLLLLPLFARRWRLPRLAGYAALVGAACLAFAVGAGWGLRGPLDGEGLFGAVRIYGTLWNFNSGLYHWLEVTLSGYRTPGAVPVEAVGRAPILAAKLVVAGALGLVVAAAARQAWRIEALDDNRKKTLALLRLACAPVAAYLLLTTTVHPWYVTFLLPFLPFLLPQAGESALWRRLLWPGLYFSLAVASSYLTYLDPDNLREFDFVRRIEYLPLYGLLLWAAWPWLRPGLSELAKRVAKGGDSKRG